jgi:predicted YcjX-like family ATPase
VLEAAQTPALQQAIDEAVTAAIAEQYRHIEKKNELHKLYNDMVNARLEAAQYNERDPEYMTLDAMGDTMKQLIGLPA